MTDDRATPQRGRAAVHRWVIVVALLITVVGGSVGAIAATGGFGTEAAPFLGTRVEPGEVIETRFWDVAVHSAEVVESKGEIKVAVTVTNKQTTSQFALTMDMLAVRVPSGRPLFQSWCTPQRASSFSPLIPADAECLFKFEGSSLTDDQLPGPGPFDVEVVVLDQEITDNMLTVPEPAVGEPAGWMKLTVTVAQEEEV